MTDPRTEHEGFESWMEKEIHEEPEVLRRLLDRESAKAAELAAEFRRRGFRAVMLTARGTSDNAAVFAKYLFEINNGVLCSLASPSVLNIYHSRLDLDGVLAVGITQSGESTDVVETLKSARRLGAYTVGITNGEDSAITREAHECLFCCAGEERSVAATKTYVAELALMMMLSAHIKGDDHRLAALGRAPSVVESALALAPEVRGRVQRYRFMETCAVLGRGYNYATALETALKLKESCYVAAAPYSSADFMHGPVAVVESGFPIIAFHADGPVTPMFEEVLTGLGDKGAETLLVTNRAAAIPLAHSALCLDVEECDDLAALGLTVIGQLFACYLARVKGGTPDRPRHLKKVTMTF